MRKSERMTPFILLSVYPLREGLQVGCVLSGTECWYLWSGQDYQ